MSTTRVDQLKLYVPGILARISLASLTGCIVYITCKLPRWTRFTLHPTMLTLSFLFSTLAILQLQEPSGVRLTRTTLHIIYQLLGLVCLLVGIGVFFVPTEHKRYKTRRPKPRISLHGLTGYIFFCSGFLVLIFGFIVRKPPQILKPLLPSALQLRSQHRLLGFLAHLALSTSLGLGLVKHWVTRSTIPNYILTISLGLAVTSTFLRVNAPKLIRGLFKRKRSFYSFPAFSPEAAIESAPLMEPEHSHISQDETDTRLLPREPGSSADASPDLSLDSSLDISAKRSSEFNDYIISLN